MAKSRATSRQWIAILFFILGCPTPHLSAQSPSYLPTAASSALGLDALAAGEATGAQSIEAILDSLDGEMSEGLLSVYLLNVESTGAARISAVIERFDEPTTIQTFDLDLGETTAGCRRVRLVVPLPEDYRGLAAVFEGNLGWGATPAIEGGQPPSQECTPLHRSPTPSSTAATDPSSNSGAGEESPSSSPTPAVNPTEKQSRSTLVRLLPVSGEVRGNQRFRTIVTSAAIDKVSFFLDGSQVATSTRAPFSARIDLGPNVEPHRVRAVALTSDGLTLGSDEILVNSDKAEAKVSLLRVEAVDGETSFVEAAVQTPLDGTLDRVEFFWNDTLLATKKSSPFSAPLATPPTGTGSDFVRVVAFFADGTWVEDVRLIGAGSSGEEISVNLVELYVVMTDKSGQPSENLEPEDFSVKGGGQSFPIERFAPAEDLALSLGLILDTSQSMWTLMPDTKRAAAMFLSRILSDRDRAFLVDFDNQPRLAKESTDDVLALVQALGGLEADGATAMFDAIAFGSLQFEQGVGRRALVLLTDGDDYKSKMSLNKAVQQAKQAGSPVYVIGLGGLDGFRRDLKTIEIEAIAQRTGGRVFLVQSMEELGDAYRQIETDLRSQYLVAFSTQEKLSPSELLDLKVKSTRKDLDIRVVISPLSQ